jgi:multiple sugar transport system ATP-binding protein
MERLPQALSGGERQRVAIGRAVVRRPRVFLFDEPLASLDAPLRAQLRHEIAQLQQRLSATLIYVTHDQAEALAIGHRVAVMHRGRIEQCAEPRVLYEEPANLFVAGFIGSPPMNLLPGTLVQDGAELVFRADVPAWVFRIDPARADRLSPLLGRALVLGLRPEHLKVASLEDARRTSPGLPATVAAVETTGPETIVRLSTDGSELAARVLEPAGWKTGLPVWVSVDLRAAVFFDPVSQQLVG